MWRKASCVVGGLALACAAAYSLSQIGQQSRAASFDLRWLYVPAKQDRLPVTQVPPTDHVVVVFDLPAQSTTIVAKGPTRPRVESAVEIPRPRVRTISIRPVREVPAEAAKQDKQDKLLEGCEPAFSPVTSPALAHISARCDS
jgi:hypothetical protein